MKHEWKDPEIQELAVQETEQSPEWRTSKDGEYTDPNGNYWESRS